MSNNSNLSSLSTHILDVTVTSSLHQAGVTMVSSRGHKTEQGCMVIEQKFDPSNNPMNIVSKEAEFWVSMITSAVIIPLLFLVGVPGNILSAVVFYKQGLRERINLCVFCLSLVDLVIITVTLILSTEQMYRTLVGPSTLFVYLMGLAGFMWVSMFLSAVIASERCFCVVSPMRAQRMLSTRTLAVVITSISLLLLTGMLVIAGPKHTLACIFDPQTNTTSWTIYVTEYYLNNKEIFDFLDVFVYAIGLQIFFFIVISVATAITAIKLKSAVQWRQQSSSVQATGSSQVHMVALTRMLIATSVLFVISLFPILVAQIAMFLVPELMYGSRYHNLTASVWTVMPVFRCLNSSLNFFVYFYMGSRFRQTVKQLLSCKLMNVNLSSEPQNVSK